MQFNHKTLALLGLITSSTFLLVAQDAQANGGHFMVDDADITRPGECALETWGQRASAGAPQRVEQPNTTHAWIAQPACTTQSGWEIAIPIEFSTSDSELSAYGLELKTMLAANVYGGALALSVGVIRDHQVRDYEGVFINFPYSYAIHDALTVHLNAGTQYDNLESEWNPTWGLATTMRVNEHLDVIAEAAGMIGDSPTAAIGMRTALAPNIELDASLGRDFEVRSHILSVGVNVAF
ncbi:MAG: hypothetical protein JJU03_00510 [Idiomarina sp.]|nr:hypothetical protein [Idiomarina sp.]